MPRPPKATATSAPIRSSPPRAISRSWARALARTRHPQPATLNGSCRRCSPSARIQPRRARVSRAVEKLLRRRKPLVSRRGPPARVSTFITGQIGDYSQAMAGTVWEHEIVMSTTRTILRQALWRLERGNIAPALLLLGALAGMTLCSVVDAQITFKSSSSATTLTAPTVPTASAGANGKITFVSAGAVASSTGTITPALPANIANDDILLLFLETANQAITIPTPNGGTWTEVINAAQGSPQGTGTGGASGATRLTVFWSRYNGTQGAPTTSDSGDHQLGRILAFRGVINTGNPWDVTAGGVDAVSNTSGSIPGTTTTVANDFIVAAIATGLPNSTGTTNFSAWANGAPLVNLLEQTDNTANVGVGGGLGIA